MTTPEWQLAVTAVGVIVTATGFGFAVWQLNKEYRWRRKQYAVNMLGEWNGKVVAYRISIEGALPHAGDVEAG
jgi:hypothetical protein